MSYSQIPLSMLGELIYVVAPDGEIWEFAKDSALSVWSNFGVPAYNFVTSTAYLQEGSTFIDSYAQERTILINIIQGQIDDRQEWWNRRRQYLNFFRPNRGGLFTLVVQQPERSFAIKCLPDPGIEFAGSDITSQTFSEQVRLRCFSPFWYDYDAVSPTFSPAQAAHLVFPITFPIHFEEAGLTYSTGIINYEGTAKSYPIITLEGPYTTATIDINGGSLIMLGEIFTGEMRIINTDPANPSIVDGFGTSKFSELSAASSAFNDMAIQPEPPGTGQSIIITFTAGSLGITNARVNLYVNYLGI